MYLSNFCVFCHPCPMQQQACIFLSLNFAAHISIEIFLDAPQESCQVQLQVGLTFPVGPLFQWPFLFRGIDHSIYTQSTPDVCHQGFIFQEISQEIRQPTY